MSKLMRALGKLQQTGLTLLRWSAVVLLGGVALMIATPFALYFWEEVKFNATTAENDARASFISYCKRTCVNPNEFDGPTKQFSSEKEYTFAWHEHNHPGQQVEVTVIAHDILYYESEQFEAAHPWESRVTCHSKLD